MEKRRIVVGGQKGGGGKSNIAANFAVLRQIKTNKKVLLVDADEQGSSSNWSARRSQKGELFPITTIKKFGDKDFINTIKSLMEDFDDAIIDVGGKNTFELRASMILGTDLVTPMASSQDDVDTINFVDVMVSEAKLFNPSLRAFMVPSKVSAITNELPELLLLAEELENFKMTKTVIFERVVYRKVRKSGLSVFEIAKNHKDYDQKAIDEITNLYNEIYGK